MGWAFYDRNGNMKEANAFLNTTTLLFDSGLIGSAVPTLDTGTMVVPTWVNHMRVRLVARTSNASYGDALLWQFNGDSTASNYAWGNAANTTATNWGGGATSGRMNSALLGAEAGAPNPNAWTIAEIRLPFATDATKQKTWLAESAGSLDNGFLGFVNASQWGGGWKGTAAINRIVLSLLAGNFIVGSRLIVYGEA